jgi:hypothetical protein
MDLREIYRLDVREIGWGGMDWVHLAQDSDWWRGLVNMAMNSQGPYNLGNSWLPEQLVASQEGLTSMGLSTSILVKAIPATGHGDP